MEKFNFAIIGYGRIAKNHLQAVSQLRERLNLVAVCDLNPKTLSEMREANVNKYETIQELVQSEKLDIVAICTPSGLHCEQALYFAKRGIHVITEKPMATRWEDGLLMVRTFQEKELYLFVVKQNRFNPTVKALKRACEEKRFGKIHMVSVNVFWNRPQRYYDQASWRGTWEMDGGALMNQASHYVDLLEWLIGPVELVQALSSTYRNIEVEDTIALNLKMRNGAIASMNVTMLTHNKNFEGSITIIGENGIVRLGGVAANNVEVWKFADSKPDDNEVKKINYETSSVYGFGHLNYYQNVIDVLDGKKEASTNGLEGLRSLEIIIAAYLSAEKQQSVSLPLKR